MVTSAMQEVVYSFKCKSKTGCPVGLHLPKGAAAMLHAEAAAVHLPMHARYSRILPISSFWLCCDMPGPLQVQETTASAFAGCIEMEWRSTGCQGPS